MRDDSPLANPGTADGLPSTYALVRSVDDTLWCLIKHLKEQDMIDGDQFAELLNSRANAYKKSDTVKDDAEADMFTVSLALSRLANEIKKQ